jgi:hypothetical protein
VANYDALASLEYTQGYLGKELDSNDSWQELAHALPAVRSAAAVVRPDMEAA